jgi:REP element-mobilizing transposase RayT
VPHFAITGGTVFLNWRLHRCQPLLSAAERKLVLQVLLSAEPRFAHVLALVVMPDHVHALVTPNAGVTARRLAVGWRGVAAHRLLAASSRRPPIWQRGYFDRWKRTPQEIATCIRYVADNPRRRWPGLDHYEAMWIAPPARPEGPA